jgi:hypothetical protein
MWWLLGLGGCLAMTGVGVGMALYGYHHRGPSSAELMAMVSRLQIKVDGQVGLKSDSEVKLKPGAEIELKPGAEVGLRPGVVVSLAPTTLPTVNLPRVNDNVGTFGGRKIMISFTVFRSVPFGPGSVYTGYEYANSDATVPSNVFCYFSISVDPTAPRTSIRFDLAVNGQALPVMHPPKNVDLDTARNYCIWTAPVIAAVGR